MFSSGSLGLWFSFIASVSFLFTLLARAPLHKGKKKKVDTKAQPTSPGARQESEQTVLQLLAFYLASR